MNHLTSYTDSLAIGLSGVCVLHCLASPLLLVVLPSLTALQLENEAFHGWLLVGVVPTSLLSLALGFKQHKRFKLVVVGCVGMSILFLATSFDNHAHDATLEKAFTIAGACILAVAHYWNFLLCRQQRNCDFSE